MSEGNSSDEDFPEEWILYADREEWKDIQPLKQDDGENPVVMIQYSEKFNDVYSYLRAVISKQEISHRALKLTHDAATLNAANYTVWQYRRVLLKALKCDLWDELEYIDAKIQDNPKNYQVWHHRRVIVEWLNDASGELKMTEDILTLDPKNYHAWQHRQWAIKTFDLFDDELSYVDRLISEDLRNNSAWNERFFVLKHTGFNAEVLEREIQYVITRIRLVKNNESPWNFLRGLLQQGEGKLGQFPEVVEFCEELYDSGIRSPYLLAFLVDLYEEQYFEAKQAGRDPEGFKGKVLEMCESLAAQHDQIRCAYWRYIAENFKRKIGGEGETNQNGI
ncbi:protein farnesyltransferase/geranylgeranyltransferase type-1 subunit alpha [Toxorhynchites rutilus septentrionalis]|uniref:protein farnesyltransferase/geranylgeranyltransferase type-1 subunit alpha n=1 Tax=Toxorhynchites rutilus septentrionalis TaxID=329112 RepID=UPI00247A71EF|nr:protein farnesyltransferase/geranylgeranyltransferase type-1 subunit alpha [Toxorhynchites rutilus septentrionalis]